MRVKHYDISLLPILRKQVTYLESQKEELQKEIDARYQDFLDVIDSKSEDYKDTELYNSLETLYQLVEERKNRIAHDFDQDSKDLTILYKVLDEIEAKNDVAQFNELVADLFEHGEYKTSFDDFKEWLDEQIPLLLDELDTALFDWKSSVQEGKVQELALLMQVFQDEDEDEDDFSTLLDLDDEDESDDDESCCDDEDGCCTEDEDEEGCCGRMSPCCKTGRSKQSSDYNYQDDEYES